MRHRVAGVHLGRSSGHRTALRRNLVTELLRTEKIRTTRAKAIAIRGQAERMITSAKRGNAAGEAKAVHARRMAAGRLNDPEVVKKLFDDIAKRYADRPGGYTRIVKTGARLGDAAEMVILELVEE
jgi:large subunit ribosomal protein L17